MSTARSPPLNRPMGTETEHEPTDAHSARFAVREAAMTASIRLPPTSVFIDGRFRLPCRSIMGIREMGTTPWNLRDVRG